MAQETSSGLLGPMPIFPLLFIIAFMAFVIRLPSLHQMPFSQFHTPMHPRLSPIISCTNYSVFSWFWAHDISTQRQCYDILNVYIQILPTCLSLQVQALKLLKLQELIMCFLPDVF